MKQSLLLLCALICGICVHAQTITKDPIKEETLPEGQLVRVHVSGRNGDAAALLQRSDGYWVYINQALYGPFEQTDALNSSPFRSDSGIWQFRARVDGGEILVVNGVRYGTFDTIWTPNFSADGNHWGSLVKEGNRYATLVDGRLSTYFDIIFNGGSAEPTIDTHSTISAPFLYGSGARWAALGYRRADVPSSQPAEFRILGGASEGPAYDEVDTPSDVAVDPDDPEFGIFRYSQFLTADGESLVLSVHQPDLPAGQNHLWINQEMHGPYVGGTTRRDNFFPDRNMTDDGSHWVIAGTDAVYTEDRVLQFQGARDVAIADRGTSFSFSFIREDQLYVYVNGREYGPYKSMKATTFSPSGQHWLVHGEGQDQLVRFTSESGVEYGPYDYPFLIRYRDENTWIGYAADGNQNGYALTNGTRVAGPFQLTLLFSSRDQHSSYVLGYNNGQATMVINGEVRFTQSGVRTNGWNSFAFSDVGVHWAMTSSNLDGTFSFIENGRITGGLAAPRLTRVVSTERMDRNALILNYRTHEYALIDDTRIGPYRSISTLVLGSIGQSWAAAALLDSGARKLILPGATLVDYETIVEVQNVPGDDAIIYNGYRDNQWFPGINGLSLGTYNAASINCSTDGSQMVYLALNEGDRKLKVYKVKVNP